VIAGADDAVRLSAPLQHRGERAEHAAAALDVGRIVEIEHQGTAAMRQPLQHRRTNERGLRLHPDEIVRAETRRVHEAPPGAGEQPERRPRRMRAVVETGEGAVREERTDVGADPELGEQRHVLEDSIPGRRGQFGKGRQREHAHVRIHCASWRRSAVRPST
jgi:hypothetical protein